MARILQIEDNNDIQKILQDFFSEEHEVIQAYSGTEGLRLFEAENIDLVLLDIMLCCLEKAVNKFFKKFAKLALFPLSC